MNCGLTWSARRYCLITPCRDEAKFARRTIESVLRQTVQPALWVIVDDGSRDETPKILEDYATKIPYIRIVRRCTPRLLNLGWRRWPLRVLVAVAEPDGLGFDGPAELRRFAAGLGRRTRGEPAFRSSTRPILATWEC